MRPGHDEAAAHLVALKESFYDASAKAGAAARAETLRGSDVEAVIAAGQVVDESCEEFRRAHYRRAARVICALGEVFTVSRTGRSVRRVYPR